MTDLKLAQDPSTPSSILEDFTEHDDEAVRRAVAINPNANKATLSRLFELFPEDVLSNPVVDLYELEEPGFEWMDMHSRWIVAFFEQTSVEILSRLSCDANSEVRLTVADHKHVTTAILTKLADDSDDKVRRVVARVRTTPKTVLDKLANDPVVSVRNAVRGRPQDD